MVRGLVRLAALAAGLGVSSVAGATTIVAALPAFDLVAPQPPNTVPSGESISAVNVSGSFGNSNSTTSASTPVVVDGVQVAYCDDGSFGPEGTNQGCQGSLRRRTS